MALRCLRVVAYLVAVVTQVIPMTTRVGLIEWMDNTAVLKETIYGQLTDAERCVQTSNKVGDHSQTAPSRDAAARDQTSQSAVI